MERTAPTDVGGYRVLGRLGQGGMGAVYRAVDADGHVVALKLLHPHLGADPQARERLRREVANLQRVRHPAVARVLDAEIESTEAFLVTELVEGVDLGEDVRLRGPLHPEELADLADRLREAVVEIHRAGVLHRDLSPGNVMVTSRGPVLIDFGIAQAADDTRVTSTGLVAGTPGYLSPELLEGGMPSEAADWWGWAALLAFAATGRPPFGSRPLQLVLARACSGEVDLAGLDQRTAGALRSALAVDPWRRADPAHVVADLRRAAAGDVDADADVPTQVMGAQDGGTRVLPGQVLDPPATAPGVPGGLLYVPWPDEEPDAAGEPDQAPPRRTGTVLAVAAALTAWGATRPGVALAVGLSLAVGCRSVGLDVAAVRRRQSRRGPRGTDGPRAAVSWPWYLLRAAVGVLPAALVAASVVLVVGGVGWWLVDTGRVLVAPPAPGEAPGELAGNAAWVTSALLATTALAGLVTVWFGPMARATRMGARWALAGVAPGRTGAATATVLALAVAAAVLTLLVLGQTPTWWPLPGPPDLG